MDYFIKVISKLSQDELSILNELHMSESFNSYASLSKSTIKQNSQISETAYRKAIFNLERLLFIEVVTGKKQHTYFITEYGQKAIDKILEGVNE